MSAPSAAEVPTSSRLSRFPVGNRAGTLKPRFGRRDHATWCSAVHHWAAALRLGAAIDQKRRGEF